MITHEEMMARGANRREGAPTIERLDPRLLTGDTNYIFNIYSNEFTQNLGTAGIYYIPPCPEGKEWMRSPVVVPGTVEDIYAHFNDKEEYRCRPTVGSEVLAFVLGIGPGQTANEDITRFGVFSEPNSTPSKQGLANAKKKLIPELQRQMREADSFFASAKPEERQSVMENDKYWRAARFLGVQKPWMSENAEMTLCPFCSIAVRPGAAKCSGCNEVIDRKAYDALKAQIATAA